LRRGRWRALLEHQATIRDTTTCVNCSPPTRNAARDSGEGMACIWTIPDRIDAQTLRLLIALADEWVCASVPSAMFRGERINRPAACVLTWRCAQRPRADRGDGWTSCLSARRARAHDRVLRARAKWRMDRPHRQAHPQHRQHRHRRFRSRAGEASEALRHYSRGILLCVFVSNVDHRLPEAVRDLDGQKPCLSSVENFTTQETLGNAHAARRWLLQSLGDEHAVGRHFVRCRRTRPKSEVRIRYANISASGIGWAGAILILRSACRPCWRSAENFRRCAGFRAIDDISATRRVQTCQC